MISCMSFNVLTWWKGYEHWCMSEEIRQPESVKLILKYEPDLLGIQEADNYLSYWCDYLSARLQQTGIYRCLKMEDEAAYTKIYKDHSRPHQLCSSGLMIFYRRERFDLLDHGGFQYTSADNQGRYFQWAKLKDKKTDQVVYMTNTHWAINYTEDAKPSVEAGDRHRTVEAKELLHFWETEVGDNLLFATGDYNAAYDSKWIDIARGGIYKEAQDVFDGKPITERKIDHCFINPNLQKVEECNFIKDTFVYDGVETHYSDHWPFWIKTSYK